MHSNPIESPLTPQEPKPKALAAREAKEASEAENQPPLSGQSEAVSALPAESRLNATLAAPLLLRPRHGQLGPPPGRHYDLVVSLLDHDPAARPTAAPLSDQLTTMPPWRPVMVLVTVSRARIAWVPAVLRVTLKVCIPALAAVNL